MKCSDPSKKNYTWQKWRAEEALGETIWLLQYQDIVGEVQSTTKGLGHWTFITFSVNGKKVEKKGDNSRNKRKEIQIDDIYN